jgi:hypothetical protein
MLQPGDAMPFFDVGTTAGGRASYRPLWQRRNVLVVRLPDDRGWSSYAERLEARRADLEAQDAALVITGDHIDGLPAPGLAIADRWGEIQHVAAGDAGLPDADALVDWLRYVQQKCPECEGESR